MKAAQISKYGSNEVVEINENAPKPAVAAGKLVVEIYAAGVNPIDWKVREGYMQKFVPLNFPVTLGGDFSGVVTEIGEGISEFMKGDEIYGHGSVLGGGSGTFAEFASVDTKTIAHKPKKISHVEAAALPLAETSALQALTDHIGISNGKKILIHGGGGGIGTVAVQLAKHLEAYVAATASGRDLQAVRDLGANEAIDYKNQSFESMLNGYDAVFDTFGGEGYVKSFKVLKKGGIIVSMVEQPRTELMQQYGVTAIAQSTHVTSERLSKLAELVDSRAIKVQIDKTFSLEQIREALAHVQTGHPRGKVVLKIK